ncbi:MAG: SUMF1/EgtB/PvdO family nonheme iron enzyme [Rhodopila sp.]|jgi:formylglycine-generating enzyme required for sulfatase activity
MPLKPKGFWSYARHDGAHSDGRVEDLHRLVSNELGSQLGLGEPVDIFLDKSSIATGKEWEKMIEARLDEASFLIVIMTPVFVNRPWCCKEINRFHERELKLGRSDLIFPIEYMDIKAWRGRLKSRLPDPDVLTLLDQRQLKDFTSHRHDDPKSPVVRRFVEDLCREIAERLYPDEEPVAPQTTAARGPPARPTIPATPIPAPPAPAEAVPEFEMVRIEPGSFFRGTTSEELQREKVPAEFQSWEQPREEVTIRQAFQLGKYPVTVGEFTRFIADSRHLIPKGAHSHILGTGWQVSQQHDWRDPGFPQTDSHPVTCVSHQDAEAYVHWLSRRTGKRFRLPTEAEWEYACRAGTRSARFWGDDRDAALWYANGADLSLAREWVAIPERERYFQFDDGFPFTAPVGHFVANPWGLHDMLGNVWEWTQDHWHENYTNAPKDGTARTTPGSDPSRRVVRGGAWYSNPWYVRAGFRGWSYSDVRNSDTGFRVARTQ